MKNKCSFWGIFVIAMLLAAHSVNAQTISLLELHENTGIVLSAADLDSLDAFPNYRGSCSYILTDSKENIFMIFNRKDTVRLNRQMLNDLYQKAAVMKPRNTGEPEVQQCMPDQAYPLIKVADFLTIKLEKQEPQFEVRYSPKLKVYFMLGSGFAFCKNGPGFGIQTGLTFRKERGLFSFNYSEYRKQKEYPVDNLFFGGHQNRTVLHLSCYDLVWGKSFDDIYQSLQLGFGPSLQILEMHEYAVIYNPPAFWFIGGPEIVETSSKRYKNPGINGLVRLNLFPRRAVGLSIGTAATVTRIHSSFRVFLEWRLGRMYRVSMKNN